MLLWAFSLELIFVIPSWLQTLQDFVARSSCEILDFGIHIYDDAKPISQYPAIFHSLGISFEVACIQSNFGLSALGSNVRKKANLKFLQKFLACDLGVINLEPLLSAQLRRSRIFPKVFFAARVNFCCFLQQKSLCDDFGWFGTPKFYCKPFREMLPRCRTKPVSGKPKTDFKTGERTSKT